MQYKLCFILLLILNNSAFSQNYADAIIGKWKSEDGKSIVEIYKDGNEFKGKIVWLSILIDEQGHTRKDVENPDPKNRNRTLLGMQVVFDLIYQDGFWQDGKIYHSKNGETYDIDIWLDGNDILKLKIYWYFTTQTQVWTRVKS